MTSEDFDDLLAQLRQDVEFIPGPLPTPCWIPRCRISAVGEIINDYLDMKVLGITMGGHVVAAAIAKGEFPRLGLVATHRCDRKCCRNPQHVDIDTSEKNLKDAKARGLLPTGSAHHRAGRGRNTQLNKVTAAWMRWCLNNVQVWYTPLVAKFHDSVIEALAVAFKTTVPVVCRLRSGRSWPDVQPVQPPELPFEKEPPTGERPIVPQKAHVLSNEQVAKLRRDAVGVTNLTKFVKTSASELDLSTSMIWKILRRDSHKDIAPEIPPVDPQKHWNLHISDRKIQEARATFDALAIEYGAQGLIARLAEYLEISKSHTWLIVRRLVRIEVLDDPSAALDPKALNIHSVTLQGSKHPKAKLTDDKVLEILKRDHARERKYILAQEFGVSAARIGSICSGKGWPVAQAQFEAWLRENGKCRRK